MIPLLKALIGPCGLIWLGLMAAAGLAVYKRQRGLAIVLLVLFLAFSVFGNTFVANTALSSLENRYAGINAYEQGKFDVVIVLGGATFTGPGGQPQLGPAGDRVMLGARLYLSGKTERLACTGVSADPDLPDPAAEYLTIWRELGIPVEDIDQLGGRNTAEELDEIERLLRDRPDARAGLVTSCWHMRRVMAWADHNGISLFPLPSGVRRREPRWRTAHIVPRAEGFVANQFALKEILGTPWW